MIVLALDPGKSAGWAVYNARRDLAQCGTHDMRACTDLGEMVAEWQDWLDAQIAAHTPDLLAMERPFGRASFTADLPAVLVGVAHAVAHRRCLPRAEYTAPTLKKRSTGNGRASKADMLDAARRFGFSPDSDHAADAACCAVAAWVERMQCR